MFVCLHHNNLFSPTRRMCVLSRKLHLLKVEVICGCCLRAEIKVVPVT